MGTESTNVITKGEPSLIIILDKYDYFPGEEFKGILRLQSYNFLKKGLFFYQIFSNEYYSYKDKDKGYSLLEENKINSIIIQSLTYPELIDYSLTKGIDIPFLINLPNDMIPSFEYSRKKGIIYNKYYLKVKVVELNLISQIFIIIKKPFKLLKELSFSANKNENFLGIFNKGNLFLKASYKKSCYEFFEKIPIEIIIINYSNKNIDIIKINIQFIRNIKFKNVKDGDSKDMIFNDILSNSEISINKELEKNGKELKYNIDINIEEPESIFNTHKIEAVDFRYFDIKTKYDLIKLIPDINSNLFMCEYKIKIECIYKSILKYENLCIYMPVSVCHKNNIVLKYNKNDNIPPNKEELSKIEINREKNIKEIRNEKDENGYKEPNIYTNYKHQNPYTPTNGALLPKIEYK